MTELLARSVELRAADDGGTVEGIAVPWGEPTGVGGYTEQFERGSVDMAESVYLFWQHRDPIGVIVEHEDRDEGLWIKARISDTSLGRDARTLLKDGAVDRFSVRFEPLEHRTHEDPDDGSVTVTRTRVVLREVSAVSFPAYQGAKVHNVREQQPQERGHAMPEHQFATGTDLDEVRSQVEDITRRFDTLSQAPADQGPMFRSYGDYVKALAAGDETATRAFVGVTSGELNPRDEWLGVLRDEMDARQPIRNLFQTGPLPADGMTMDYLRIDPSGVAVGVQAAEGDDLAYGKLATSIGNVPVVTLGGWSDVSRQAIERTSVPVLDSLFTALAIRYAAAVEAQVRATLNTAITAAATLVAPTTTQDEVTAMVVDVAEYFNDQVLTLGGLLVSKDVFLDLLGIPATDRVLQVSNAPTDKLGSAEVRNLTGNIGGVRVDVLPGAAANTLVGYDTQAVKLLEAPGAPYRLQDSNIVNLTQAFSVYGYVASFAQYPAGLVKVNAA